MKAVTGGIVMGSLLLLLHLHWTIGFVLPLSLSSISLSHFSLTFDSSLRSFKVSKFSPEDEILVVVTRIRRETGSS